MAQMRKFGNDSKNNLALCWEKEGKFSGLRKSELIAVYQVKFVQGHHYINIHNSFLTISH